MIRLLVPVLLTATKRPLPYATSIQLFATDEVLEVQVIPEVTKLFGISTSPFANTVKRLVFDEVATLNTLDVPFAVVEATLKVTDDDVALIPATDPLSKKSPVERDVAEVKRARNPFRPPDTPVDVTH
jgi:glutamine synthetase type III